MKKSLEKIIKLAIDVHVHIGPEIIPRKYTVESLIDSERGKIAGMVLKNHFFPTSPFIEEVVSREKLNLFGSIVLNNSVGGLNPEAILSASQISSAPIIVWFPTINAENFLKKSEYEIAPEWVMKSNFSAKNAKEVEAVRVTVSGELTAEILKVLSMIKKCNTVLATGHISWEESKILSEKALIMGVRVIITHPIYQRINMPTKIQQELAKKGCFIEQSYSMYSIDKIPIKKISQQIKAVGSKSVILSSDVGQPFSPSPSKALYKFCKLLMKEEIGLDELYTMLVINPKKLLGIV